MQCKSCEKQIDDDSLFCKFCGVPTRGASEAQILPTLFTQQADELRARRDAEHIYTAAAIGSFGAIAWGVAALANVPSLSSHPTKFYYHPAIVAAFGTLLITLAVGLKIVVEHRKYADGLTNLRTNSNRILRVYNLPTDYLPQNLTSGEAGSGYLCSIGILCAGALLAIAFSLSIWNITH